MPNQSKNRRSVLYVGQCYYNHWYLSRELRKLGWKADQLNLEPSDDNKNFYHGEDYSFNNKDYSKTSKKLELFLNAIANYENFHFANQFGLYFISDFDHLTKNKKGIKRTFMKLFLKLFVRKNISVVFRLFYIFGPPLSTKIITYFASSFPERWDIYLLKYFGKKIIYTNNGCHDGTTKANFQKWLTPSNEPVCSLCPLFETETECNDVSNHKWGRFRNAISDLQHILGGYRVDYNIYPTIYENPWNYCLDKNFWSPELLIPANFILPIPKDTIKIYHAVGNFDSRTQRKVNLKSTYVYVPLIEKLKKEGYNIELIFFKDVPNQLVRYYQAQADIFVDMLSFGFYGANIREGMMLGKPCVCYLRPEWLDNIRKEIPEYVDELPIVDANEYTIEGVLIDLIKNKKRREAIGKDSRAFAEKWHASDVAAKKFAEIYESLQG